MPTPSFSLQELTWDSDFLGFPVGRLAAGAGGLPFEAALAAARQAGYHLLYVVLPPGDQAATAARQAGAWLADRKVTFTQALAPAHPAHPAVALPAAIEVATDYTAQLESLAWQSGEYSRFRLDPRFDPSVFQRLYSQWLRNSLSGSLARQVLVWRAADGAEQGLLTLGEKNGRADIGLLAVDAAARGQQVGQHLVAAAVRQAQAWGYPELQVVTQGDNAPACRFYEKCGFRLAHEEHIYHLWLAEAGG